MASSGPCKYYIAKTFLHLAGGLGIAAASSQAPILDSILTTNLAQVLGLIVITLIVMFGMGFLYTMRSGGPAKYLLAALLAALFGQLNRPLVERLEDKHTLFRVFALATGTFVGMFAVGMFDSGSFLGIGSYLLGALVGLIIAQLILVILRVTDTVNGTQGVTGQNVLSFVGVGLFALFTAYDTQKIRQNARLCRGQPDYINESVGIFLDFINLFANFGSLDMN